MYNLDLPSHIKSDVIRSSKIIYNDNQEFSSCHKFENDILKYHVNENTVLIF